MKLFFILLAFFFMFSTLEAQVPSFSCDDVVTIALCQQEFSNYIVKYNLQLSNGEAFHSRLIIFCDNYEKISSRNCFGNHTSQYGLNQFR